MHFTSATLTWLYAVSALVASPVFATPTPSLEDRDQPAPNSGGILKVYTDPYYQGASQYFGGLGISPPGGQDGTKCHNFPDFLSGTISSYSIADACCFMHVGKGCTGDYWQHCGKSGYDAFYIPDLQGTKWDNAYQSFRCSTN